MNDEHMVSLYILTHFLFRKLALCTVTHTDVSDVLPYRV